MKMKKIVFFVMMTFCASLFQACDSIVDQTIQSYLDEQKKELPVQLADGLVCDDITVGENGFVYHFIVSEDKMDMDVLKANSADMKAEIIKDFEESIGDDHEQKEFLEACVELEKPLTYKYEGDTSGTTVRVKISTSDIKKILGQD